MTQFFRDFINFIKAALGNGTISEDNANNWIFVLTAIALLFTIVSSIWKFGNWISKWRSRRRLINDLAPYYTKAEIYQATANYIRTKYQNVAPSEDDEPGRTYIASAKNKMIPLFLNKAFKNDKDDAKYYLILADAGMGKTTFMINLYLAYKWQWRWWNRRYDIKMLPLGHPASLKDLEKMDNEAKKNTILLLDALDEDSEAVKDYQKRMQEVLDVAWRFREIVVTCRTQFFPSKEEEPTNTGYFKFGGKGGEFKFQKLYVSVFDNKDINRYLLKKFSIWNPLVWKKLRKARKIVKKSPNLVMRPMLLSHIEDLVEQDNEFKHTFEIYEVMIEKWIEREAEKPHIKETYGSLEKFKEQLFAFSQSLAVDLYLHQGIRGGLYISKDEEIKSVSNMQLSDLEVSMEVSLKESGWRSRSLLNRNADGFYKFSHKSILEYFLAKEALENPAFGDLLNFEGLDTAFRFRNEMFIAKLSNVVPLVLTTSKENPLLLIDNKQLKPSRRLVLRPSSSIQVNALRFVQLDGYQKVLILNEKEHPNLYLLYIHYFLIREQIELTKLLELLKGINWVEQLELFGSGDLREVEGLLKLFELRQLQELRERLILQEQFELQELFEFFKLLDGLELSEWLEGIGLFARLNLGDLRKRIERLKQDQQQKLLKEVRALLEDAQKLRYLLDLQKLHELQEIRAQIKIKDENLVSELLKVNNFIKQVQLLEKQWPNIKFIY